MKQMWTPLIATALAMGCASAPSAEPRQDPAGGATETDVVDAPPPSAEDEPRAVLHLEPYLAGLRTVRVAIGDTSLPFLLDTGGGITLVVPEVASALGCDAFGRSVAFRHSGEPVALQRCPATGLHIDGWPAGARELGVWDLMSLLPAGVPELGGIVALNTFEGRAITLDLGGGRLVVESRGSLERRVADIAELRVREAHQAAGSSVDVFLAVESGPGSLWFEIDSGNTGPVLIAPHAARQLGLDLSETEPTTVTLELEGYGPVTVEAIGREMIYDGLLNAALLEGHVLTLDLLRGRGWLADR